MRGSVFYFEPLTATTATARWVKEKVKFLSRYVFHDSLIIQGLVFIANGNLFPKNHQVISSILSKQQKYLKYFHQPILLV